MKTVTKIAITVLVIPMLTILLLSPFYLQDRTPFVIFTWLLNLIIGTISVLFLFAATVLGRKVDYIFGSVVTVYVIALCVAFYNLIQ